jgi:uncharacterized membrane protein YdbT with pleckstrin-like domain
MPDISDSYKRDPQTVDADTPNEPLSYATSVRSLILPFLLSSFVAFLLYEFIDTPLYHGGAANISAAEDVALYIPISLLIIVVWMARPLMLLFDSKYEVTSRHIRTTTGRFSLKREEVHIPYEEVKGVRARQSMLGRILGIGDVLIWTGLNQTPDVVFRKVFNPNGIAAEISDRVDQAIIGMKRGNKTGNQ